MINGFASFDDAVEPLRYYFANDGDEWFAQIGFVGPPLGDDVRAIVNFVRVDSAQILPSYYCFTLLERRSPGRLALRRDQGEFTITAQNLAKLVEWMRSTPRTIRHGVASESAVYIDGRPALDLRHVEQTLSLDEGADRVRWFDGDGFSPISVDHRRKSRPRAEPPAEPAVLGNLEPLTAAAEVRPAE